MTRASAITTIRSSAIVTLKSREAVVRQGEKSARLSSRFIVSIYEVLFSCGKGVPYEGVPVTGEHRPTFQYLSRSLLETKNAKKWASWFYFVWGSQLEAVFPLRRSYPEIWHNYRCLNGALLRGNSELHFKGTSGGSLCTSQSWKLLQIFLVF